ncbi:S8 family peptidase [Candidatus Curtissbacteria bacterium]|nr:S8 family peptidase [Candidatus Curtissbacteria bacterium]
MPGQTLSVLLLLFLLIAQPVWALTVPSGPQLPKPEAKRFIVTFKKQVDVPDQERTLGRLSARRIKRLALVNAQVAEMTTSQAASLRTNPAVFRVEEDAQAFVLCHKWWQRCRPSPSPSPTPSPSPSPIPTPSPSPSTSPSPSPTPTPSPSPSPSPSSSPAPSPSTQPVPWGVDRIDAEKVWTTSAADSIKVAVIDTGFDLDHPDLAANIKGGTNTINPAATAEDDNGHGSHVAGIIAAVNNSIGVVGVGHQVDLYAVKVLNRNGYGYVSDIIEGIEWSIANNMNIINMSLGTSSDIQSFHDAVIAAKAAGITVVAAAGNSGPGDNTVIYPAKYAESIAVSAVDSTDGQPYWSSRGPEVDLAAPGVSIYSTYKGNGYTIMSGTSMASPHVAGSAALVLSTHPGFSPDQIQAKLQLTADNLLLLSANQEGSGLVDAEEAALTP